MRTGRPSDWVLEIAKIAATIYAAEMGRRASSNVVTIPAEDDDARLRGAVYQAIALVDLVEPIMREERLTQKMMDEMGRE